MKRILLAVALMMACGSLSAQAPAEFQKLMDQHKEYVSSGDFDKAITTAQKAKTMLEKSLSDTYNGDYFNLMQDLGEDYFNSHKFKESINCCIRLADILQDHGKTQDDGYLTLLNQAYVINSYIADDPHYSIKLLTDLGNRMTDEELHNCELYVDMMTYLGDLHAKSGNSGDAVACYADAQKVAVKVLGKNHEKVSTLKAKQQADKQGMVGNASENSLEGIAKKFYEYYDQQNFLEATKYGEKAIKQISNSGELDINAVTLLNNVSTAFMRMDKFKEAVEYLGKVVDFMEKNSMTGNPGYSVILANMGALYGMMGDTDNETNLRIKAMRTLLKTEGINAPNDGGNGIRDFVPLLETTISNFENIKTITSDNAGIAILGNISFLDKIQKTGDKMRLLKLFEQKLESSSGLGSNLGYTVMRLLGQHYYEAGDFNEALRNYDQSIKIAAQVFGDQSLDYARTMVQRVNAKISLEQYESAIQDLLAAEPIIKKTVGTSSDEYLVLQTQIAITYFSQDKMDEAAKYFEKSYNMRIDNLKERFRFMTNTERSDYYTKNIEPLSSFTFHLALKLPKDSKYLGSIYNHELLSKGLLLSSEAGFHNYMRKTTDARIKNLYAEYQKNGAFIKAESQKQESERAPEYADIMLKNSNIERELVTIASASGVLSQNLNVSWTDVQKSLGKNDVAIEFIVDANKQYAALVLTADMKAPRIVPLFEERDFKRKVYQGSDSESDITLKPYESTVMYNEIWRRLEEFLTPGCNVYFAPKGMLHTLAIEYAPIGNEKLILNNYNLIRVSSTRNLTNKQKSQEIRSAVVYGGIKYNYKHHGMEMKYLKGSYDEMDTITKCLSESGINAANYTGDDATVASFQGLSDRSINILHVATHGLFEDAKGMGLENSGLAMSDKVITSAQIAEMNLANTGLLVLSACETAKGNVSGEGVFGLQRAFKLAGCKTIIMSLWPVNDYATRLMMTEFYNNMYLRKMSERDAFRRAVDNLRFKKYTTPIHWAAFIMLD